MQKSGGAVFNKKSDRGDSEKLGKVVGSRKDAKDAKRPAYRIDNKKMSKETAS